MCNYVWVQVFEDPLKSSTDLAFALPQHIKLKKKQTIYAAEAAIFSFLFHSFIFLTKTNYIATNITMQCNSELS